MTARTGNQRSSGPSVDEMPCDPVVLPDKDEPVFLLDEAGPFLRWGWMPDWSSWAIPGYELLS